MADDRHYAIIHPCNRRLFIKSKEEVIAGKVKIS